MKTFNELISDIARRARQLGDEKLDSLRIHVSEADTPQSAIREERYKKRGELIEEILYDEFSVETEQDFPVDRDVEEERQELANEFEACHKLLDRYYGLPENMESVETLEERLTTLLNEAKHMRKNFNNVVRGGGGLN